MKKQIWIVLVVMALAAMACTIDLPVHYNDGVGATKTVQIDENYPSDEEASLTIEMGAGELNLSGGGENLVAGTIRYNMKNWKPEILKNGDTIIIRQTIDKIDLTPNVDTVNEWDLQLGNQPLDLKIKAGAYQGYFDLSGVPLTGLSISDGASQTTIRFDTLNPVRMEQFDYNTGASDLEISGLANANAANLTFNAGAGKVVLDFSGELQEDMYVLINGGAGDVEIIVPEGTSCILTNKGTMLDVNYHGWDRDGETYTLSGDTPVIRITSNLSLGSLNLDVK